MVVWTSYVSAKSQRFVQRVFEWIGYNAFHHSCLFIFAGILLTLLCSLGFLNFYYVTRNEELWVPTDGNIYDEYLQYTDYFGDFDTATLLLIHDANNENLLKPGKLDALYEMFLYPINNISIKYKNKEWTFEDLCERYYDDFPECRTVDSDSIFALWGNQPDQWSTQQAIDTQVEAFQTQIQYYLGGRIYEYDETSNTTLITGGTYVALVWRLWATTNDTIYEAGQLYMEEFQNYWSKHREDYETANNFSITYVTARSWGDEMTRVFVADAGVYLLAIIVMVSHLAVTLGQCNNFKVHGRPWLAVSTVIVMIMALIIGYGLGLAVGYGFNNLVLLVPYILLGVGVDDQIIIVESVDRTPFPGGDRTRGAERLQEALKHSGLSITLTSFCSVMAFAIGSLIDIPGVSAFCVFSSLSFLANDILQFLIFLPLLAIDERRMIAGRNACCACIKHEVDSVDETNGATSETTTAAATTTNSVSGGDGGGVPTGYDDDIDLDDEFSSWFSRFSMKFVIEVGLTKLLSNRVNRLIIIVIFLGLFVMSLVSLRWLKTDSDISRFVPDDSYALEYLKAFEKAFGEVFRGTFYIVILNTDFSDATVRSNINSMITDFNDFVYKGSYSLGDVDNWLEEFEVYVNDTLAMTNDTGDDTSVNAMDAIDTIDTLTMDEFYWYLEQFTDSGDYGAEWETEIIYNYDENNDPISIEATKFSVYMVFPASLKKLWPLRNAMNEVLKTNDVNGFTYEPNFPFAYFEYIVVEITIKNILLASSGVLLILFLLLDAKMAVFVIIIVLIIDFDLFGWVTLWGVSLDALVFLQLVIAVGLTVDYCIHITHAIAYVTPRDPNDYNERIRLAMKEMGVGVAKGAWTTYMGCFVLIFSQSEAFRTFFYVFSGVIVVALAHGMLFVPSIVGELPFLYKYIDKPKHSIDQDRQGLEKTMPNSSVPMAPTTAAGAMGVQSTSLAAQAGLTPQTSTSGAVL